MTGYALQACAEDFDYLTWYHRDVRLVAAENLINFRHLDSISSIPTNVLAWRDERWDLDEHIIDHDLAGC